MNKLELLELSKGFSVESTDGGFVVTHLHSYIVAFIDRDEKEVEYCISGVYNSGSMYANIDMEALKETKSFCELMIKE